MKDLKNNTIRRSGVSPQYANAGTHAGCWKFDLDDKELGVCPRIKKMLELPKTGQVQLVDIFKLMPAEHVNRMVSEFKFACAHGSNFETQIKVVTASGNIKWLRISGVLYYRRWGTADKMIGVVEDTTQRVNEESLSLAVVNHELRNPLTVIKLNVQLLMNILSGAIDKYPLKVLNTVDMHINCMTNLMEEYLNSSVNEHREPILNHSIFNLDELIEMMMNEMRTQHPGYRFCKQGQGPVWVRADKYKIMQVFINYATNAVNFSPRSSQISISLVQSDTCVEVAIKDQGIGIPVGQEHLLFQKFYRCDAKAVRQKNSKGLGLYLVKEIINEHGGTVRAEQGMDGGSVFYFSLPLHAKNEYQTAARAVGLGIQNGQLMVR